MATGNLPPGGLYQAITIIRIHSKMPLEEKLSLTELAEIFKVKLEKMGISASMKEIKIELKKRLDEEAASDQSWQRKKAKRKMQEEKIARDYAAKYRGND